jgi:hypothetical protein
MVETGKVEDSDEYPTQEGTNATPILTLLLLVKEIWLAKE